jgi:hypothetical protein
MSASDRSVGERNGKIVGIPSSIAVNGAEKLVEQASITTNA